MKRMRRLGRSAERRNVVGLVLVALLAGGIGVAAYATHLLRRSELQTIDARFAIRGAQKPPSDIVFVAISVQAERELKERHLESRSPLPRKDDAEVLDHLRHAGAKAIAMDMEFTQQTNEKEDDELIEAVARVHGKVVLGTVNVATKPPGETEIFGGNSLLREIGARPAEVRLTLDSDGVVRRFDRSYNHLGSFPLVAAETMLSHRIPASTFESDGSLPIDFAGPPETFKTISYAKVMRGEFPAGLFQGALVIVGASSPILQDIHSTSTTGGVEMPGPEIWANAAATLLQGVPLRFAPGWLDILVIIGFAMIVPLGSVRVRQWRSFLSAVALAIVFTIAVQVAFDRGAIVTFVYPLLALTVGTLGTLAVLYVGETIERARVHDLFSRFVPADVVEQVVASAGENLRLGAVERDCTVLFSDLRGFTSFSEKLPATRVIEVVNCYLNEMTEAILAAGGTLISYMGDGIMAVFGAPLEQDDHADRALTAATEMINARLDAFNAWIAENGHDHAFAMGIGINSGTVMAGNIGSEKRVEYTALGDTTNTASRLEGMTKGSGHMLFIADSTRARMRRAPENMILVGELEVRGRVEPVPVWTITEPGESPAPVGHIAAEDAPTGPAGTS
jgi:adenylate cyclase